MMPQSSARIPRRVEPGWSCLALAVMLLAGGCASVERRYPGPVAGDQGGAWEAVFPAPGVAQRLASADAGPELSRRDGALGMHKYDDAASAQDWVDRRATRLTRTRTFHIGRDPHTVRFPIAPGDAPAYPWFGW